MADIITYPENGIRYYADDASGYLSTRLSGVYSADEDFAVTANGDLTVTVSAGQAWVRPARFRGRSIIMEQPTTLPLTAADAVALHLLGAQLGDDGRRHRLGDDVELAVAQIIVDDEAHKGLAVHDEALLGGFGGKVGFGLASQGGVVAQKAAVIVGVDEHGIKRGSVLLACADHLLAAHLLLGLLGNLHGRQRGRAHAIGGAFHGVFHLAFEF